MFSDVCDPLGIKPEDVLRRGLETRDCVLAFIVSPNHQELARELEPRTAKSTGPVWPLVGNREISVFVRIIHIQTPAHGVIPKYRRTDPRVVS